MTDSRTHTPTPWSVQIVNPESAEIVSEDGETSVADYLTPDDAERIVHCVNSHDMLVDALTACAAWIADNAPSEKQFVARLERLLLDVGAPGISEMPVMGAPRE